MTAPPQLVKSAANVIFAMPERKVAQLADEAAEAVHLLDGPDEAKAGARLHLVLDALDKVVAKAEGLLRAGQGPLALEALVAVAGEVVRPDEIPGVVWKVIAGRGVLGRLAFATERAIPLCPMSSCQEFIDPMDKVVARGGCDFRDALAALRARALVRRKTTL